MPHFTDVHIYPVYISKVYITKIFQKCIEKRGMKKENEYRRNACVKNITWRGQSGFINLWQLGIICNNKKFLPETEFVC